MHPFPYSHSKINLYTMSKAYILNLKFHLCPKGYAQEKHSSYQLLDSSVN